MGEQRVAKVKGFELLYTAQREESVDVVLGGFRRQSLALVSAIVQFVIVDAHGLAPSLQVANRWIGPY
eukprot:394483-Pleurochrysis_carterae.AAC.1